MEHHVDPTLRALNRFGLGARPGQRQQVDDPRAWLEEQLEGNAPLLLGTAQIPSVEEAGASLRALRTAQRARDQDALRRARQTIRRTASAEARLVFAQRVASNRPFLERLVAFWSNHLCVSVGAKPAVLLLAGRYEREAIRPHVLGRFEDMVLSSARHPAMLLYLDNAQSVGPSSRVGRRTSARGQGRGLNENYARELLELHTLGVDGGYTQADVVALAHILTGWGVAGTGQGRQSATHSQAPEFSFVPAVHDPGPKALLGVRYDQGGEAEGETAIRDLCRHPATARFVARKLVQHFVADEPPEAAVARVADIFTRTRGDLRAVAGALIHLEAAWEPGHRKFRTPQDWLVAALRALDVPGQAMGQLVTVLRQLRQPLWAPDAPKGYGDTRDEWADPDALMNRAELARTLAGRAGARGIDPVGLLDVVDVAETSRLPALLSDGSIGVAERVALALAGPEFQWR